MMTSLWSSGSNFKLKEDLDLNTSNNGAEPQMLLFISLPGQLVGVSGQPHVEGGQGHDREDRPLLG